MYKRGTVLLWQYFENYSCVTVKMEAEGSSETLQLSSKLHSVTSQKTVLFINMEYFNFWISSMNAKGRK
jgi:hypothetical protein